MKTIEAVRAEALIRNCDFVDGCWLWRGALQQHSEHFDMGGYPKAKVFGKVVYVHRWLFGVMEGQDIGTNDLHHICNRRTCINPKHLVPMAHGEHQRFHSCHDD